MIKMAENRKRRREDKRIKTVVWDCELGCGATNTRVLSMDHVINDDMCDACGKVYHEPNTKVIEVR